jgi:hypothetical protein
MDQYQYYIVVADSIDVGVKLKLQDFGRLIQ